MRLKLFIILLLTITSCTTFASKEYKLAINESKEAQSIEFNQISNDLDSLKKAKRETQSAIESLRKLPDSKSDQRVDNNINSLREKQKTIEARIQNLEEKRRQERIQKEREQKFEKLRPYVCKALMALATNTKPNIINIYAVRADIYLEYIRPEDNKRWSYVCRTTKPRYQKQIKGRIDVAHKTKYLYNKETKFTYSITEQENKTLITINSDSSYYGQTTFNLKELK